MMTREEFMDTRCELGIRVTTIEEMAGLPRNATYDLWGGKNYLSPERRQEIEDKVRQVFAQVRTDATWKREHGVKGNKSKPPSQAPPQDISLTRPATADTYLVVRMGLEMGQSVKEIASDVRRDPEVVAKVVAELYERYGMKYFERKARARRRRQRRKNTV